MPASKLEKALIGLAGTAGAGILVWRTQFPWIKYDIQLMKMGKRIAEVQEKIAGSFTIDRFEQHVTNNPKKPMVIFEDCIYTYEFMDQQANRIANVARKLGLKLGDTVAVLFDNEPAFIWTVFGLQKMGIAAAWLNFNLRMKPLSHSILTADPKALFVGAGEELHDAVMQVMGDLGGLPVYMQGLSSCEASAGVQDLDGLMMNALPMRPDPSVREGLTEDSLFGYIYTSGTTGLPKPAIVSQAKVNGYGLCLSILGTVQDDVVYTCLPLYHSAGGGIGLIGTCNIGCTIVLKRKFSASHFWSDCRKYNVTILQYIGELFRYVLAQPPHELDSVHKVRAAIGNGLRKDIFEDVVKRFKIPLICEFFGATEGVSALFNLANRPGAIGRISPFLTMVDPFPKVLVKYDHAAGTPIRDENGRCIKVKPGDTGLFISKVPDHLLKSGKMAIYKASEEANNKKLLRNVFQEGDIYFSFGDVFYLDKDYFVYFSDRIGDTFRWKGENVSTTEVSNTICALDFIEDANVYGVTVPNHDGRAGMAALTLKQGMALTADKLKQVYKVCRDGLPTYARPLFLRVLGQAVLTGTYKQRKVELREEGYDISKVTDDLYCLDAAAETYRALNPESLTSFLQSKL